MKIYPIIFFTFISFIACNKSNNFSDIKVGMTYDEVEDILGKPKEITRGANKLEINYENIPTDILERLNFEIDTNITNRWYAPNEIQSIGNLIYVNWVYEKEFEDTFYVLLNTYKSVTDTMYNKIPIYYLNGKIVSKNEYMIADDEYISEEGLKVYKPARSSVKKMIKYNTNTTINDYKIKTDSTEKIFFIVNFKYCILFDASSGRVTQSDFFPFDIKKIKSSTFLE